MTNPRVTPLVPASEPRARGRRPRVLLAEDDPDFRDLVHEHLERDGYRVTPVHSGRALLRALDGVAGGDEPPALLLADEQMPGKRGLAVLAEARRRGWTVPMLLVTAFADPKLTREAERLEVSVVDKPVDMDDLRTLVALRAPAPRSSVGSVCEICGEREHLRPVGRTILCRRCLGRHRRESASPAPQGCSWFFPPRGRELDGDDHD